MNNIEYKQHLHGVFSIIHQLQIVEVNRDLFSMMSSPDISKTPKQMVLVHIDYFYGLMENHQVF